VPGRSPDASLLAAAGGNSLVGCRGLDDDGSGAGGCEALGVGYDVLNGVRGGRARVDLDGRHGGAVDEGLDAEIEVGCGSGDGGA